MDLKEFTFSMAHAVEKKLLGQIEVMPQNICKNNGVILQALLFRRKGSNVAPTIYMEPYFEAYQKGEEFSYLVQKVIQSYEQDTEGKNFKPDFFLDYEKVRKTIVYRLVNYQKNKKRLAEVPHLPYLDMALVFYSLVSKSKEGMTSILIRNENMEMWKATHSMLYEEAKFNTPRLLKPEFNTMAMMLGGHHGEFSKGPALHILTNDQHLNGASSILYDGMLERCAELCRGNYFLLPSSIHEVILAPYRRDMEVSHLKAVVREANQTVVDAQEILSDSVYFYSKEEKKLLVL